MEARPATSADGRSLDAMKRSRRPLRAQLVKRIGELDNELSRQHPDRTVIQVKLEMTQKCYEKVETLDESILPLVTQECEDDEQDAELASVAEYEEKYRTVKVRAESLLDSNAQPSSADSSVTGSYVSADNEPVANKKTYKLPKIELKKFSGELKDWLGFWSQFEKIHTDKSLHDSDKFQYLVQCMIPDSKAHLLVSSYPQSEANYPLVIDALKDRFGDKVLLTEVYVRQLLKLVMQNAKQKCVSLSTMYDELESHLRALETLGVTREQSAAFLYPLVESSLPVEVVKVWQRSILSDRDDDQHEKSVDERLKSLMKFLRMEVKGAERLSYVSEGFSDTVKEKPGRDRGTHSGSHKGPPTAAGLLAGQKSTCIFCDKSHTSETCIAAQSMAYAEKKRKAMDKRACLVCLKVGHIAKTCQSKRKCMVCHGKHVTLMCPELDTEKKSTEKVQMSSTGNSGGAGVHSQLNCTNDVVLQTLRCVINSGNSNRQGRVLLDTGSQRSYILERTARQLSAEPVGEAEVCHLLFGGVRDVRRHNLYKIRLEGNRGNFLVDMQVLGHDKICERIPSVAKGPWMDELKEKKIFLTDLKSDGAEVEVLIGADYYAKLMTGRRCCLKNGLVAMETQLGWTVSGKLCNVSDEPSFNMAMQVTSMFVKEASVSQLWDLETIGICDTTELKARGGEEVKQQFLQAVKRSDEGRYVVSLPWNSEVSEVPDNRDIAIKRLESMTKRLVGMDRYHEYDTVLTAWLAEGLIETVDDSTESSICHYLPHRAVFKPESLTTPVRPVFDASCKVGRSPSLNDLLEKGPNLLEAVPAILLRFRQNQIGMAADIRKAFQMIEVDEKDRDCLRFFWWKDLDKRILQVFRHKRVVFGVNCSPFLLAAVIELHLGSVSEQQAAVAQKLLMSFYVDNCATSVSTVSECQQFKQQATEIMSHAGMDLRNWEFSRLPNNSGSQVKDDRPTEVTKVLGLVWNKVDDTLSCDIPELPVSDQVTKRDVLSYVSQIFDPIGFLSPVMVQPKLILQSAWLARQGWDEELPQDDIHKFKKWQAELRCLQEVSIARHIVGGHDSVISSELHTFSDASQDAYAAVVFLRSVTSEGHVSVQLLMAKSRLAPLRRPTMPRLELLACVIGARLTSFVKTTLNFSNTVSYLWSDSTAALAWIKRNNEWGTFVGNRVREICSLTKSEDWRHVPGVNNPADLPSRGCSPAQLLESRWWEGAHWLYECKEDWPVQEVVPDEVVVSAEQRRTAKGHQKVTREVVDSWKLSTTESNEHCISATLLVNTVTSDDGGPWYLRCSTYIKNVRVVAWIRRFVSNCKLRCQKTVGELATQEFIDAENIVVRAVQQEEFSDSGKTINGLMVSTDSDGLYRVKTKLLYHDDSNNFCSPVLLPQKHPLVVLLIRWYHLKYHHAGTQFLINKLRERFWICQARRAINRVVHKCPTCLRHSSKSFQTDPAVLPANRTSAVNAFENTGVDLAGPLHLRNGDKVWIVLFTCAVYRCVHIDFVMSVSTEAFVNALWRFVNVRGRPKTVYSDNGTNFIGTTNLFNKLNWPDIERTAGIEQIKWIFNPPSAAWWGGWWERLIRTIKDLLKRMLGNSRVDCEQLRTCLSHVENVVNERPLTTVTEDQNDLIPLTPAMFLRGIRLGSFPEGWSSRFHMQQSYQKQQSLLKELQDRFKREYLALLVQRAKECRTKTPKIGDVVLVGSDDRRRLQWPLARIVELIPGRDGVVRTAKVKTQNGILLRPVQRLFPLEVSTEEELDTVSHGEPDESCNSRQTQSVPSDPGAVLHTRSGRCVTKPRRYQD